ncbi:hypothetical protein MBM_02308 [Drepanopeziza brunnea f. sp. 'multigermtubi' MB_m1]|uniref:Cytochrome P450 n=1 Tax=Marssonina brunnea f. sp. multigermtubi (strain MB_m1) TaxID=1072389 RepID=K1X1G5_MARBU|nr:uncharacterized protein MBM_02308 [Drepanopeziza brunnea f. sp. 'multigermtubi' MB_m1]EKD19071.1 hypothetical protein MBM_02308 [Drepanopeziza brunnea f. sp. 'multigermtubi' MB_m1]
MFFFYLKSLVLLLVSGIVYGNISSWIRWRRLRQWGKQYGCGEAPKQLNKLPWGVEKVWFMINNIKGLDFLEYIRGRYVNMQCYTYRIHGLFFNSMVTTSDPENIQAILATKFPDYDLGPARNDAFYELLGNGIFTAEGKSWSHFRQQLRPQFTRDQVSDLEAAEHHLNVLFKALPEENASGWVENADWLPLLYRFTLDTSTEFLFGRSVNSQSTALHASDSGYSAEEQENLAFAKAMTDAQEYVVSRLHFRIMAYFPMSKAYKKSCATVKAMADRFVKRAVESSHERKEEPIDGEKRKFVLLDALVAETKDPIELRDQTLHILLAGRDTTSSLLGWTILLLARHPEAFQKLRRAVMEQFGSETRPTTRELNFASLKACKEMTHVLYETLRLYPIVPINGRLATRNTVLPTGGGPDRKQPIAIRKGEPVGYSAYVMHRRRDLWGEDADDFKPDRWEGRKLGWEFVGFSGGPRVCIGQQYALNEASFFMVRVLQRYDVIEALDMTGPLKKGLTITLQPGDGVKVRMHRASS